MGEPINLQLHIGEEVTTVHRALSLYRRSVHGDVPCCASKIIERLEASTKVVPDRVAGEHEQRSGV